MKKIIIFLIMILMITGCSNNEKVLEDKEEVIENKEEEIVETKPTYVDDNPITIGMYVDGKLVSEYNTVFVNNQDLVSFDVYYSNEEDAGSKNTKRNFNKYFSNYQDINKYKIGYFIRFNADNKYYEKMILDSDNELTFYPYIFLYLYDDIHVPDNTWYSHVTKQEENDETIFSSIKLHLGEGDKIEGEITITAFTYDGVEDFDEDGYYRGKSSYTVVINNK